MRFKPLMFEGRSRRARYWLGGLAFIVLAFILALWLFQWSWLKSPIERAVYKATGRQLVIAGDLSGKWALRPRIRMESVHLQNPEWANNPEFLAADAIEIQVNLPALLVRRVHIHDLVLERPVVALERTKDGRATWLFDPDGKNESSAPVIDALRVDDGVLQFKDALSNSDVVLSVQNDPAPADERRALKFGIRGKFRSQPVMAAGTTESLLLLRDTSRTLPIDIKGTVANTQFTVEGEFEGLQQFENVRVRYSVQGKSLRELAPIFNAPLLETPAYRVAGALTRQGERWETTDLKGKVGSSDIAGTVVVTTGGKKPFLETQLNSELLDLADLGPLIGTRPGSQQLVSEEKRLFPNRQFDLSRIEAINAHVVIKAKRVVRAGGFPFDNFLADFHLDDSVITIDPLEFGMADGKLRTKVEMDARQMLKTRLQGRMTGVKMARIFPERGALGEAAGVLSGFVDLRGTGNSVAATMDTACGRLAMLLADGRVPTLWPAVLDLDGARILGAFLKRGKNPENVTCGAFDLNIVDGVATPVVGLIETESTVINVKGTADLGAESLDLRLQQAPKKPSILSLRTPITVKGPMSSPRLGVVPVPLAARGAAAITLGLLNPLAALFALLETGPGKDGTCPEISRGLQKTASSAGADFYLGEREVLVPS